MGHIEDAGLVSDFDECVAGQVVDAVEADKARLFLQACAPYFHSLLGHDVVHLRLRGLVLSAFPRMVERNCDRVLDALAGHCDASGCEVNLDCRENLIHETALVLHV